jgi:hypothetical protein
MTKGIWEWQKGHGNVCGFGNDGKGAGNPNEKFFAEYV